MADYAPGMRLIIRDEEWMVRKVETNSMANPALHCVGVSPLVKDREVVFLSDLEPDIRIVDPALVKLVIDKSPRFRRSKLYLESQWRQQIPTDTAIHIGDKAAMDPMPFQLDPAQIALNQTRQRILIADSVGLGKTLEAGILMSELILRGKGRRILVVTVKSMMTQFQKEMWNRFTIPLVRLDSSKIQKIRQELPSNYNPFFYYDKTIISIDTLKRDVEYRTHLENAYWDIIVIDEAHNVAERGSHRAQRSRLASLLAERSDTMILLSATPHDGKAKSFASLMNMLNPTAIANPNDYTSEDIKGLCVRRFKKDIKDQISGSFKERRVELMECHASKAEEKAFEVFSQMQLVSDMGGRRGGDCLFKTTLEKALFSSPAACIKSVEERIKKLIDKVTPEAMKDIESLQELKDSLAQISPEEFSRYQQLLTLLGDKTYGWNKKASDDRVVIFTERIETMKYVAEHLRQDLKMPDSAIQEISGSMNEEEQQKIVENFGRTESPIRILVASDVASEGINLHYLCHRMVHFDIPWSLMVFQQRNGRIDRYGQAKQPDIRYMLIKSDNDRIRGDARILEILVNKEEQALKNLGDPALLLGKFKIEEEELVVVDAIESGADAEAFEDSLEKGEAPEINLLELLLSGAAEDDGANTVRTKTDRTLFTDKNYLSEALSFLSTKSSYPHSDLEEVSGLDITVTPDMHRRLSALLPEEAVPKTSHLRLSDDKGFIMEEMKRSMQNNMEDVAWPSVQYLWKLHPLFSWVNDKAGLFYDRSAAPLLSSAKLRRGEIVFVAAGSMPNRRSTPLVDEWFGILYRDGRFVKTMTMEDAVSMTGLDDIKAPNPEALTELDIENAESLRASAVEQARNYLSIAFNRYNAEQSPKLDKILDDLAELAEKHRDYQLSLFEDDVHLKNMKERRLQDIDDLFNRFADWVKDTMTIENNPYIRIISVVMGV